MIAQGLEQMLSQISISPKGSQPALAQALVRAQAVSLNQVSQQNKALHAQHENNKTALIFCSIVNGIA